MYDNYILIFCTCPGSGKSTLAMSLMRFVSEFNHSEREVALTISISGRPGKRPDSDRWHRYIDNWST